jgi:hypothetical protein
VKAELWRTGRDLLQTAGMAYDAAGSFLGKLVKDYGQVLVLDAVRDCTRLTPANPSEWLVARCQERRARSANSASAIEARNTRAASEWVKEMAAAPERAGEISR